MAAKFLPRRAPFVGLQTDEQMTRRRERADYRASSCDSLDTGREASRADGGRVGPDPTPSLSIEAAISSRSRVLSSRVAASIQPSICAGDLAPTIAPVTPGQVRVHATAIAAIVVL